MSATRPPASPAPPPGPAIAPRAPSPVVPPAAIHIDRVLVRVNGDAAAGRRLADRLPASLTAALGGTAAQLDERTVRRLVEQTVRRAAR